MSTLPCDGHGSNARGRLLGFYATLLKDNVRFGTYKRYCYDCMAGVLAEHHRQWFPRGALSAIGEEPACTSCGTVVDDVGQLHPFYVTSYPRPDQRVDYEARYCKDCSDLALDHFQLSERTNGKS